MSLLCKLRMTAYHGIKACCFCILYISLYRLLKNRWARGQFRMLMQSRCDKPGHAECQSSCTKPISKDYCPPSNGLEAWCRKSRDEKQKVFEACEKISQGTTKPIFFKKNKEAKTQMNRRILQSCARQGSRRHLFLQHSPVTRRKREGNSNDHYHSTKSFAQLNFFCRCSLVFGCFLQKSDRPDVNLMLKIA